MVDAPATRWPLKRNQRARAGYVLARDRLTCGLSRDGRRRARVVWYVFEETDRPGHYVEHARFAGRTAYADAVEWADEHPLETGGCA